MREAVFELMERINAIEDVSQRVQALQQASNGRLQELLVYALSPHITFDLPEGEPPYKPEPGVYTHGIFWQDIRLIPIFLVGGKLSHMQERREYKFIEMLENIHPNDAKLLIAIKDRKWPYSNINREVVNTAFPNLIKE